MQSNIRKLRAGDVEPCIEKREVIQFLISSRRCARTVLRNITEIAEINHAARRLARKHRDSGNPLLIRNAKVIETQIASRKSDLDTWDEVLLHIGINIRAFADDIDRLIPTKELFDILNVNPADRAKVGTTAGLKEIVFIHGLEDSATHRGSNFKGGPLFEAMSRYMTHAMKSNPELERTITDSLFGKGGLFEFVPTYSRASGGEFKRNPAKLRLADETDTTANRVSA